TLARNRFYYNDITRFVLKLLRTCVVSIDVLCIILNYNNNINKLPGEISFSIIAFIDPLMNLIFEKDNIFQKYNLEDQFQISYLFEIICNVIMKCLNNEEIVRSIKELELTKKLKN